MSDLTDRFHDFFETIFRINTIRDPGDMLYDYLDNSLLIVLVIISLIISLFKYIDCKKKCWLYSIVYFIGALLSSYFWAAHLIIMNDYPQESGGLSYFGWNIAYFVLLLLLIHMKSVEERKYFHPLVLIPIPLNIWQLTLYLRWGSVVNNIYQVSVITAIECLGIQGILWHYRKRTDKKEPPWFMIYALVYGCVEFGLWTSTCFDYPWYYVSYPLSILYDLTTSLLYIWMLSRSCEKMDSEEELIEKNSQRVFKILIASVVIMCSVGGLLLAAWIRSTIEEIAADLSGTRAYNIIPVILFLISVMIAIFCTAVIFVVHFEQKAVENSKLREEARVAEKSNIAKSDFLANMSHEIRTPINAILGINEIMLHESLKAQRTIPDISDDVRKEFGKFAGYAGNIDSVGNSLITIINDILDMSKIEAGKMEIFEDYYELSSVLNDVSNMIIFKAKAKGLEYNVVIDKDIPDGLFGDGVRIRQILTNVLNNAVKYTDHGSVTLSVRGKADNDYKEGDKIELLISVKDTGIGIRKEDIERLFYKFERVDLKNNSTVEGTGLGLAITHQLLEMMGGSIEVSSNYKEGSEFVICLPQKIVSTDPVGDFREKFERSMQEAWSVETVFIAPGAHILIVDDTNMNLVVAVGLLQETQMVTDTADSGEKALEMAGKTSYDVILLDQRMPRMDGIETLRRLRENNGLNSTTPVICLTADAVSGARERYVSKGFTDYLSKPIDSRRLMGMLLKYIPKEKIIIQSDNKNTPADAFADETSESENAFYEVLKTCGINTSNGLKFCNDNAGLYKTLLNEFFSASSEQSEKLQRYLDAGDYTNYGIIVHSLKNTSRTIGATSLSEIAVILEKACEDGNSALIEEMHPELMSEYHKLADSIMAVPGISQDYDPEGSYADDDEIMEFMPVNGDGSQ